MNALEFFAKVDSYSGYEDSGDEETILLPSEVGEKAYFHRSYKNGRYFYEYIMISERDKRYEWFYIHLEEILKMLPVEKQYEVIQRMKTIEIEFEPKITYDELNGWYHVDSATIEKYPLYSVRGTCNMEKKCNCEPNCCSVHDEPCCFGRKVGCSATSQIKNPEYYEFLPELVLWMAVCPDLDAVYVMHDQIPVDWGNDLYFSFAFLLRDNKITYINDRVKVKKLYEEYHKRYPCDTSKIEDEMNSWNENASDFHF